MRVKACGLVALVAVTGATAPAVADSVTDALRGGGYVIVFRHGATHADQADTDPFHLDNVAVQRQLNDKGRTQAREVGELLRSAGLHIGKCYSSRFNRAVETARAICGKDPEAIDDVTEGGLVVSPNENTRRAEALRALLSVPPASGTNTVIITHKPNLTDALGKDWFDVKEGEASIFRPEAGSKYTLVRRVPPDQWIASSK